MMPLSYSSFGFTGILMMVAFLTISQAVKLIISKHKDARQIQHHKQLQTVKK